MQKISEYEWLMIALANALGTNDIHKGTWNERIEFGRKFVKEWSIGAMDLIHESRNARHEYEAYKILQAIKDTHEEKEVTYCMPLDASSSGPQIMSILTGCLRGMQQTNVISTGKVQDLYTDTLNWMNEYLARKNIKFDIKKFIRKSIKNCVMTTNYNSSVAAKILFGENTPEYDAFQQSRNVLTPGCVEILTILNESWDSQSSYYEWTNIAEQRCVVQVVDKSINRDTGKANCKKIIRINDIYKYTGSFSYQYTERGIPCGYFIPLVANVIQSIDAGIKNLVEVSCKKKGFDILCVHDEFRTNPWNMSKLCDSYREALIYLFKNNHLQEILRELRHDPNLIFTRKCGNSEEVINKIVELITNSQYAIN